MLGLRSLSQYVDPFLETEKYNYGQFESYLIHDRK